ncbi:MULTISPECIES: hypothetical protein [unclassified Streptomyces]|uniref:hypothetical protein n=1 Tax=Streptomyces sp. NPDC055082 TaxID=3365718 RepID=UPI0037CE0D39
MHEFFADADADAQAAARPPGSPRHSGRRHVSFKEHQVLEAGAAEERFALSADVHCSHDGSGLPVRLYGGDLHIRGDLDSERKPPHWPAHVIVTGTSSSDRTTAEVIMAGGVLSYGLYARGAALAALGKLSPTARTRTQRWVSSVLLAPSRTYQPGRPTA